MFLHDWSKLTMCKYTFMPFVPAALTLETASDQSLQNLISSCSICLIGIGLPDVRKAPAPAQNTGQELSGRNRHLRHLAPQWADTMQIMRDRTPKQFYKVRLHLTDRPLNVTAPNWE